MIGILLWTQQLCKQERSVYTGAYHQPLLSTEYAFQSLQYLTCCKYGSQEIHCTLGPSNDLFPTLPHYRSTRRINVKYCHLLSPKCLTYKLLESTNFIHDGSLCSRKQDSSKSFCSFLPISKNSPFRTQILLYEIFSSTMIHSLAIQLETSYI